MKKYLLLASAATMLLASCSDEFNPSIGESPILEGKSKIHATFPIGGTGTRTSVSYNEEEGTYPYSWASGDALGVWGFTNAVENTDEETGEGNGDFTNNNNYVRNVMYAYSGANDTFVSQAYIEPNQLYFSYYPYSPAMSSDYEAGYIISNHQSFNNEVIKNKVDWTWKYATGSFANGAAPAIAIAKSGEGSDDLNFTFSPLGSYLVFPIEGIGTVNSIKLVVDNEDTEVIGEEIEGYEWDGYIYGFYALMNRVYEDNNDIDVYGPSNLRDLLDKYIQENDKDADLSTLTASQYQKYLVDMYMDRSGDYLENFAGEGEDEDNEIILDCGAGIPLSIDTPVNFWFVVDPNTPLAGSTISLYINDDPTPITKTFAADWNQGNTFPDGSSKMIAGRNQVRWLLPAANTAYLYTGGSFLITKPWQFLEYAYLATNGADAIYQWVEMNKMEGANLQYSDLQNMVIFEKDMTVENLLQATSADDISKYITGLKPALLVGGEYTFTVGTQSYTFGEDGILDIDQDIVKLYVGMNGTNLYETTLPEYYEGVYSSYIKDGYIPTIGGGYPFTMTGLVGQDITTLTGLTVQCPGTGTLQGMFKGGKNIFAQIENLILDGNTVNYAAEYANGYYFLARPYFSYFDNVTIGAENTITLMGEALPEGTDTAIFNFVQTSWYKNGSLADYDVDGSATDFYFAYDLQVNSTLFAFNESKGYGVDDFVTITVIAQGDGAVLTFAEAEEDTPSTAAAVAEAPVQVVKLLEKVNPQTYGYSIVDNGTSYWTGTTYVPTKDNYNTAEELAYGVQNASNDNSANFTLNMNLNLMGEYTSVKTGESTNSYWWTDGTNDQKIMRVTGSADYSISNVYINGTDGKDPVGKGNYLTLLGNASVVTALNVNGITIENNAIADAKMAAISSWPYTGTSSAYVENMSVNVTAPGTAINGAVGGLYVALYNDWMNRISPDSDCSFTTTPRGAEYGVIAGQLTYNVNGNNTEGKVTVSSPFDVEENTFGKVVLSVTPYSNGGTYVTLDDFAGITGDNLSLIPATNVTTNNYYTVYVYDLAGGMTYVYTYSTTAPAGYALTNSYETKPGEVPAE